MEQPKQPQYLKTDAPGDDLYDGKPQERVAQAIAGVIREDQFKLLGLDGTWGAGKSNVIRILQKLLRGTHHFFVYDAWSHQEDPQRRVFLEEFTEDLINNKVVKSNDWQKKLKELLAKNRDTITKTIPKLSPAYYALVITILLSYVFKSLSELICQDDVWSRKLFELSPGLALLLLWGIAALFSREYRNLPKMFSIYKEKELEKVTSETVSESEPTVRQFRNWMTRLSDDFGKKRVVVVFDNLDRLPADNVKALWSAIQTFLSEAKEHYPRITFIVPFDRAHISKAFGASDKEDQQVGSDFIDKTFPIIFNVALPPLTGWQGFFETKFKDAFGNIPAGTYEQIEHIFDLYHPIITPRSIILFINELVTLRLIWKEEIDMRYMALFVATKVDILKAPLDQLLRRDFAANAAVYFKGDDDLPKNIAALLYNVPLEIASQVTLYREIQTAFRAKDVDRIKELHLHPDFFAVLKKMITGAELSVEDLVFALSSLEQNANTPEDKSAIIQLWPSVAGKQIDQNPAAVLYEDYHGILIEKVLNSQRGSDLIRYLVEGFYNQNSGTGESYFKNLNGLDQLLKKHGLENKMLSRLSPKNVSADFFLSYLYAAKSQHRRFKVSTNEGFLDSWLINMINTDFPFYPAMEYISEEYPLRRFKSALRLYLENKDSSPAFLYPALFAYRHLERKRPVEIPFSKERIKLLLQLTDTQGNLLAELLAIRIAAGDDDLLDEPYRVIDATTEPLIPQIARTVEYYINLGELIGRHLLFGSPFSEAVIRYHISNPSPVSNVDLKRILPKVSNINKHFHIEIDKIFDALDVWYKPIPGQPIMPVNDLPYDLPNFELVSQAAQYPDNRFAQDLIAVAKVYVSSIEPSDWFKAFTQKSEFLLDLTATLLKGNLLDQLPPNANDPFKHSIMKTAQGGVPEAAQLLFDDRDIYLEFLKAASPTIASEVIGSMRDIIEARKASPPLIEVARYLEQGYFGPVQIASAIYSSIDHPEKSADVTELMKLKVEHERLLHGHIINETMGGDPDSGYLKKLTVEFNWAGKEIRLEWNEGEYWRLPNG